jgi:uncharacterized protein (DUF427 family)
LKATLENQLIAASDDIVDCGGYAYFPQAAVRIEVLEKAPKSADDHACPHGVQFYDVVIDGRRHSRAAWSYEAPRGTMQAVANRFGFWGQVSVAK